MINIDTRKDAETQVDKMVRMLAIDAKKRFGIEGTGADGYTVGYLKGLLTTLACKSPVVLDEVISTIDYMEEVK